MTTILREQREILGPVDPSGRFQHRGRLGRKGLYVDNTVRRQVTMDITLNRNGALDRIEQIEDTFGPGSPEFVEQRELEIQVAFLLRSLSASVDHQKIQQSNNAPVIGNGNAPVGKGNNGNVPHQWTQDVQGIFRKLLEPNAPRADYGLIDEPEHMASIRNPVAHNKKWRSAALEVLEDIVGKTRRDLVSLTDWQGRILPKLRFPGLHGETDAPSAFLLVLVRRGLQKTGWNAYCHAYQNHTCTRDNCPFLDRYRYR
jgi:hypothetical protein